MPRGVTNGRQLWGTEGAWVSHGEREKVPTGGVVRHHWKQRLCTSERALLRRKTSHKTIRLYLKAFSLPSRQEKTQTESMHSFYQFQIYLCRGPQRSFKGGGEELGSCPGRESLLLRERDLCPDGIRPGAEAGQGGRCCPPQGMAPLRAGGSSPQPLGTPPATHAVSASNARGIAALRVTFSGAFPAKPGLIPTGQ